MKKVAMNRIIYVIMALSLAGCSTVCPEGLKFGPYGAFCAPYEGYKFVKEINNDLQPGGFLNPNGKLGEESENRSKQFILSEKIRIDFSNDGEFMSFVMSCQNRFKAGDWGNVSQEEKQKNEVGKKGSIGKYVAPNGRIVFVEDKGSEYSIFYEDENLSKQGLPRKGHRDSV
jgi:hypothetical protein